jgi:hypothetical protein
MIDDSKRALKGKSRNTKPGRPPYLPDARVTRDGEQIGGGFFVFRRGRKIGRVQCPEWPYEHPDLASAHAEAERLRAKYPGERFDVFAFVQEASA